mmetsp:Transcript_31918/g.109760  ORF Transcript_31918/g.109760 Transcript_31918/m.109760 type:complete len:719 (-) Transcript_31918:70-2226(-)
MLSRQLDVDLRLDAVDTPECISEACGVSAALLVDVFQGRVVSFPPNATTCFSVRAAAQDVFEQCRPLQETEVAPDMAVTELSRLAPGWYELTAYMRPNGDGRRVAETSIRVRIQTSPLALSSRPTTVLSLFLGHDANAALVVDGVVVLAFEFERLFEVRYFAPPLDCGADFEAMLSKVMAAMAVDIGTLDYVAYVQNANSKCARGFFGQVPFVFVDHHRSHALLGLYDSPFQNPVVMSFDGGGNDGVWQVYSARKSGAVELIREAGSIPSHTLDPVDLIRSYTWNFGANYAKIGAVLPEVVGSLKDFNSRCTEALDSLAPIRCVLGLAGKIMGYAALGMPRQEWLPDMRRFLRSAEVFIRITPHDVVYDHVFLGRDDPSQDWQRGLEAQDIWRLFPSLDVGTTRERDLAATLQRAFELEVVQALGDEANGVLKGLYDGAYDGIVLVGGCALNVLANSEIEKRFATRVHVPSSPNDGGLSVGAAWHVLPPSRHQPLQYAGPELFDRDDVEALLQPWVLNGTLSVRKASIEELAQSLALEDGLIGIARGRAEFGPRALGHRSLLAYPRTLESKDRLNVVKYREWWRPVAPIVALEDALRVFETLPRSPYMSFAATLTDAASAALPAISHYDGTARPQIVNSEDDAFLYALLLAVKRLTGWAVLINTSLNTRGRPILNTLLEALELYHTDDNLGALVVGDKVLYKDTLGAGGERGSPTREL